MIKNLTLIAGLIVGLILHDGSTLLGWLGTIGLIAGFFNVYYTTKRSTKFLIPDMIWIFATLGSLIMTGNYTDMLLYIFYIFIGFKQFVIWKGNKNSNNQTIIKRLDKSSFGLIVLSGLFAIIILGSITTIGNFIMLGYATTVFGILGSILLAYRYLESEYLFLVSNVCSIYIMGASTLYQLMLIPIIFSIFSIIFILENSIDK